jgi:hypothetical protein
VPVLPAGVAYRLRIGPKTGDPWRIPLAFTVAPHLQSINYHGCFSPFAGI